MRRLYALILITPLCWGLAMACSGDGGQAPSSETAPSTGASGQVGPVGTGPGGGDVISVPAPQVEVQVSGKSIVYDGSYPTGKLTAHASDPKNSATTFHWTLIGPGIAGGTFGDGADFSFDLPLPTDKSNYVLTVIAKLGGKAVQKDFSFFILPAPSAKIVANVNQAAGLSVVLVDNGIVLKGQKIQFSADAKFANQYKWQISKDGAKAQELGTSADVTFDAKDVGQYQVALQVFGDGGFSEMTMFNFSVGDNAVAMDVKTSVEREASQFSDILQNDGKYPIDSVVTIDAAGIGSALTLMSCVVKDTNNTEVKAISKTNSKVVFTFDKPAKYEVNCSYTLKTDFIPKGNPPISTASFEILPKAKAVMTLDGKTCDPAVPLPFLAGSDVKLSATNSTGNITTYLWKLSSNNVDNAKLSETTLHLANAPDSKTSITLDASGIGDRDSALCTVIIKESPNAVIASDSTVQQGRSYIFGSVQRAHATVKSGEATGFDWKFLSEAGSVLKQATTQKASDSFDFVLSEVGTLVLKLTSKFNSAEGSSHSIDFKSKGGQVSLITPVDFSNIQSIAAASDTDVYFASPSAIFHKGVDGRVVQVKNISTHPALPNGFFARNAGDIYLLTTDGGFWRYTFKEGWTFTNIATGTNEAIAGSATGTRLFVVFNSRLFSGDAVNGGWTKIGDDMRYVTVMGSFAYAANTTSVAKAGGGTDPGVVKCSFSSCTTLKWQADAGGVTWKSIGTNTVAVYLSSANGSVFTIQNDLVTKLGDLSNDDYIVAFSKPATALYGIGNKGGVYRVRDSGVDLLYTTPVVTTTAGGVGSKFWAQDNTSGTVIFVKDASPNPDTVVAQKSLGTPPAACVKQKQMWMVGETAYVSVCSGGPANPTYRIFSVPYEGNFQSVDTEMMSVVAVASDGAGGVLIMRSDGTKSFVKQLKLDGTLQALKIPLGNGEVLTGMSGKFFITNQGIRRNDGQNYPLVKPVTDAHHPFAVSDVLYFSYQNDARLAKFDLGQNKLEDIANVDPTDPIVDILVDVNKRVYVLTASALYRYDNSTTLTKIYETPDIKKLMTSMAIMNDHHMLLSLGLKGLVLVDLDGKVAPQVINASAETPGAIEILDVGYNGTEFMLLGHDGNGVLQLHQFGAPQ